MHISVLPPFASGKRGIRAHATRTSHLRADPTMMDVRRRKIDSVDRPHSRKGPRHRRDVLFMLPPGAKTHGDRSVAIDLRDVDDTTAVRSLPLSHFLSCTLDLFPASGPRSPARGSPPSPRKSYTRY